MTRPKLRIYFGPEEQASESTTVEPTPGACQTVTVSLNEILPLLAEAYRSRRVWLDDFAAEEVAISSDLYDVLLAYESLHRPSA